MGSASFAKVLRPRRKNESVILNMQQARDKTHCLMVLKASHIYEVVDSIKEIDMDKAWFVGYTEVELTVVITSFIQNTDYDYYWMTSHDLILSQVGVDCLVKALEEKDPNIHVMTGYCNLSLDDPRMTANSAPYDITDRSPSVESYSFITKKEIKAMKDDVFETYFCNWGMSGMSKHLWLKYPFMPCAGEISRSDLSFTLRFLEDESNKIFSHKDGFFLHLKSNPDISMTNVHWLIGAVPPHLILEIDGEETEYPFVQSEGFFGPSNGHLKA